MLNFLSGRHALRLSVLLFAGLFGVTASYAQSLYFPPEEGDNWESVDPVDAGWNPEQLNLALELAGERNSSGVVILHKGRLMAERYWPISNPPESYSNVLQGYDAQGRAIEDVASAQKSIAAILTGIAQQKGLVDIAAPVSRYLGEGWSRATPEQEQRITLVHLLSMSSGLTTEFEYEVEAGSKWFYNTPVYHLLMRVLEAVTGEERNVFTRNWLTAPLGLVHTQWVARPWADASIGSGLSTTARELARVGLLVQAGGRWNDQIILDDPDFLQTMLRPSQQSNPSYGYLWWLNGQPFLRDPGATAGRVEGQLIPSAPPDLVTMQGALDRKLYIVPSLDLVIARLGSTGAADDQTFNQAFWEALMKARLD